LGDSAAITVMLDRPVHHARARVIRVDNHGSAAYLYLTFFTTKKTVRAFDLYEPHQSFQA
jgi:hypothetical protein